MNQKTAERLYRYRKNSGLSQDQLAEKIGVSRQAVSKWERGEASPDTDNLIALSEVYGVSLDELIKGKIEPDRKDTSDKKESAEAEKEKQSENNSFFEDGGVHIRDDKRGESVHIGWKGIHVDTPDAQVHIDKNGVYVQENGHIYPKKKKVELSKTHRFFNKFPYPVLVALAYVIFGCFDICGGWGLGWLVFLTIPLYYTLVSAIASRNGSHFAYPVLVVLVYLWLGFNFAMWHPMWLLFITVPLYYFVCEFIKKLSDEHFKQ